MDPSTEPMISSVEGQCCLSTSEPVRFHYSVTGLDPQLFEDPWILDILN